MKKIILMMFSSFFLWHSHAQTWTSLGFSGATTGGAVVPTIAFDSNNILYTVYSDLWDDKASVKKFTGSTWSTVGASGFTSGNIVSCGTGASICVAPDGTPYIAYPDTGMRKASVMKFDGSNWVYVGSPCFSAGQAVSVAIAIDNNGNPYVVYCNLDSVSSGATVEKFNGTDWIIVGASDFSGGYANFPSIAIGPANTPFVAYGDYINGGFTTVKKFDGFNWVDVGAPDFSLGFALYTSIAIDRLGTPYVAYQDQSTLENGATVMKYNGSSWVVVGVPNFSAGAVAYTNIVIDTFCTPYVSYADYANSQKASVMKFDGTDWVSVGAPGFSAGPINFNSLALDRSGTPYLAYTDTGAGNSAVMKFESTTKSVQVPDPTSFSVSLQPNPNNGIFFLSVSSVEKETTMITICNVFGEVAGIFKGSTNSEMLIPLDVKPGIYFVTVNVGLNKQETKIIVW